jgi:eukaryotic-like serine/threonine-protein kinase
MYGVRVRTVSVAKTTPTTMVAERENPVPNETLLERSVTAAAPVAAESLEGQDRPGSRYTLLEPLGRGAAGVVYAAYDAKLDRRVAVKLLKGRGAGGEAGARLIREARALARLAHPNVAQVYDVGQYRSGELVPSLPELNDEEELPAARGVYIILELIDGESLRQWLRRAPRSWKEVLAILCSCAEGLAAAHDVGLVHRDFKPANVLLGADGRPRVVDFGLARAGVPLDSADSQSPMVGSDSGGSNLSLTHSGTVLGTPSYMSPEQHRAEEATPAADQYAFCVVLYEALCGRRPFHGQTLDELRRQKESEVATIPAPGVHVPRWVWPILRRGFAADPERRFPSMRALLEQIETARRARRRALVGLVLAPSLVSGALVAALTRSESPDECADQRTSLIGVWDDAARERGRAAFAATDLPYAAVTWASTEGLIDAYVSRWSELRRDACVARRSADEGERLIAGWSLQCLDDARDAIDAVQSELGRGDVHVVDEAIELVARLPDVERCGSQAEADLELRRSAGERAQRSAIERELTAGDVLLWAARYDDALAAAGRASEAASNAGLPGMHGRALVLAARIRVARGDAAAARPDIEAAIVAAEQADDPDVRTLAEIVQLYIVGTLEERLDEAERMVAPLVARVRRRATRDELSLEFYRVLGSIRDRQGRYREALEAFETSREIALELFGEGSLQAARAVGTIGLVAYRMQELPRAREHFTRAHDAYRRLLGDEHPSAAAALGRLAVVLADMGDLDGAIDRQREIVAIFERSLPVHHHNVVNAVGNLAVMLHKAGQDEEAQEVIRRALEHQLEATGAEHPTYGLWLGTEALIVRALGDPEQALASLTKQLELYERVYGAEHVSLGVVHVNLAGVLMQLERFEEAEEHARRALAIDEATYGPEHPAVAQTLAVACIAAFTRGAAERAALACRRALDLAEDPDLFDDADRLREIASGRAEQR